MLTKILHYKTTIIGKMMSRSGFMTKDRYTSQVQLDVAGTQIKLELCFIYEVSIDIKGADLKT